MYEYIIHDWMREEQERRMQLYTDLYLGKPLDHIPLEIRVSVPQYSVQEQYLDGDKQLEDSLRAVKLTWELGAHTDAIPNLWADVGCSCIANAFGAKYVFLGGPDQTPSIKDPVITDLPEEIGSLQAPDLDCAEWINEGLRRMRIMAEVGQGFTPQAGLDAAGGLNVASDLLGVSELLIQMIEEPEAVHQLLNIIQNVYLELIEREIAACGGLEQMTTTDFFAAWAPMGHKGHCSDDISALISPQLYQQFGMPYHARVYEKYGNGGLHNCGPNPCREMYMTQREAPMYLDLSERYSRNDLAALKTAIGGRGFLHWGCEQQDIREIVEMYRGYMQLLAPDLLLIPTFTVSSPETGIALYDALLPLAQEYASRMEFGFPGRI